MGECHGDEARPGYTPRRRSKNQWPHRTRRTVEGRGAKSPPVGSHNGWNGRFPAPFKHLVALFKENEGFRQTRGLMHFTARLLKSVALREDDDVHLIGTQHLALNDDRIYPATATNRQQPPGAVTQAGFADTVSG